MSDDNNIITSLTVAQKNIGCPSQERKQYTIKIVTTIAHIILTSMMVDYDILNITAKCHEVIVIVRFSSVY